MVCLWLSTPPAPHFLGTQQCLCFSHPPARTVYCMSEAELVDVALGILLEVQGSRLVGGGVGTGPTSLCPLVFPCTGGWGAFSPLSTGGWIWMGQVSLTGVTADQGTGSGGECDSGSLTGPLRSVHSGPQEPSPWCPIAVACNLPGLLFDLGATPAVLTPGSAQGSPGGLATPGGAPNPHLLHNLSSRLCISPA